MVTDGIIEMFGLELRTFGTKKGVKDLKPILHGRRRRIMETEMRFIQRALLRRRTLQRYHHEVAERARIGNQERLTKKPLKAWGVSAANQRLYIKEKKP